MLAGIWLGAINPYALGLFGASVGACVPALLVRRPWRRGARGARGVLGGERGRTGADPERRARGLEAVRLYARMEVLDIPTLRYLAMEGGSPPGGVDRPARVGVRAGPARRLRGGGLTMAEAGDGEIREREAVYDGWWRCGTLGDVEEHGRLVDRRAERNPGTVDLSDAAMARERLKMVRRSIERHGGP
jgi:hypothetical protein